MRTLQYQLSLNRVSSNIGLIVSFMLHALLAYWLYYHHIFKAVTIAEPEPIKLTLNSYKPITAPVVAPEVALPPPAPEPVVTPPPPKPEPIVKKVEPKQVKEQPKKKPKPDPVKKPVEKQPEPVVAEAQPTPAPPKQASSAPTDVPTKISPVPTAPIMGEFNINSSAGDENFYKIRKAIEKHKEYPRNAKKMRHQGIVEVKFIYTKNGDIKNLEVIKSSGYSTLDEGALRSIQKASKDFPRLERDYRITIPIGFRLA